MLYGLCYNKGIINERIRAMNANEYTRLKQTLELTGLNEKQVEHILSQVKYMASSVAYRARQDESFKPESLFNDI